MRIVINTCFGDFSLSPRAVKRLAELNGRECFFFINVYAEEYQPISLEELTERRDSFFSAFDIPDTNGLLTPKNWKGMTEEKKQAYNDLYDSHYLDSRPEDRADPKLIQVVEELGSVCWTGASGIYADLKIVEIPDGIEYEIEEYDGLEHIAEKHRTWG